MRNFAIGANWLRHGKFRWNERFFLGICMLLVVLCIPPWIRLIKRSLSFSPFTLRNAFPILAPSETMWTANVGRNVSACVIVRTLAWHEHCLGVNLASIAAASHSNITVKLIDTGRQADFTSLPMIVKQFNMLVGFPMASISKWTWKSSRALFPAIGDLDDEGYIATDLVVRELVQLNQEAAAKKQKLPCEAILVTSGDNILAKGFFMHTLRFLPEGHNMVAVNYIDRTPQTTPRRKSYDEKNQTTPTCGGWRPGAHFEHYSELQHNCVDVGAVLTSWKMWKEGTGKSFLIDLLKKYEGKAGEKASKAIRRKLSSVASLTFEEMASTKNAKPRMMRRVLMLQQ